MINRQRRTQAQSVKAPIGGLNDKNSIADMPISDALQLDNWFPGTTSLSVRGGSTEFATGLSTTGESLLVYNDGSSRKIFAAAGGNVYDITAGGAVGAASLSGKSNARWDFVNFGNSGANYLVCVNGADLPIFYNGSAWAVSGSGFTTAITGVAASLFTQVNSWKTRLFFVEKNSLRCWYLGTGAIGGAATVLDFSGVAKLGGFLVATSTITTSAGVTLDDYFVAITSEGECLVYRGTNPADMTTFALVGNYRIGRPIANGADMQGGRWIAKYASDMVCITADGFTTLQGMLNADVVAQQQTINSKIINSVTSAVSSYKSNFGWQIILCPLQNKLIINVPTTEGNASYQYVMNTITGAWCRFIGWNATCFANFQDDIYAIIGTKVYIVDVPGKNDNVTATYSGDPIVANAKTSFVYFGGRNSNKMYRFARPLLITVSAIQPFVGINTNFADTPIDGTADISTAGNIGIWNRSQWQPSAVAAKWGGDPVLFQDWLSVNGIGYNAALKLQVQIDSNVCNWQGWEMQFESGGLI